MSREEEVREASTRFYAALNKMLNGDPRSIAEIWSHDATVTTMHPVGGCQVGWDEVWATWEQVAQASTEGKVQLKEQRINVSGDLAYETGVENAEFVLAGEKIGGTVRVTNAYRRDGGVWKITHHHTDTVPAMVAAAKRLAG